MGISYSAVAGIGYELHLDELALPPVLVQSCEHPDRIGQIFCPSCGTKVNSRVEINNDAIYEINDLFEEYTREFKDILYIPMEYDSSRRFLGWGVVVDQYDPPKSVQAMKFPSFDGVKERLNDIVEAVVVAFNEDRADVPIRIDTIIDDEVYGFHTFMWAS